MLSSRLIDVDEIRDWLRQRLQQKDFFTLYQPIFDIQNGQLFGYEALLRVDAKYGLSPLELFSMARAAEMTYELDMSALQTAICSCTASDVKLFINVFPSTLLHPQFFPDFERVLHASGLSAHRIMLEINENEMIANYTCLKECLERLQEMNVSIVLDDVGSGYSLQMLTELESDMIKIDRFLVEDVDQSPKKQRMLQFICELTERRMRIVAEGIETEQELATLRQLGIPFGQGYLLGRPAAIG